MNNSIFKNCLSITLSLINSISMTLTSWRSEIVSLSFVRCGIGRRRSFVLCSAACCDLYDLMETLHARSLFLDKAVISVIAKKVSIAKSLQLVNIVTTKNFLYNT